MSKGHTLAAAASPGDLLRSVFPAADVRPPKDRQRFDRAAQATVPAMRTALYRHLEALLGVHDESFVYGQNRWVPQRGGPFHSRLASSPPPNRIRDPDPADHATQSRREAGSPVWSKLAEWRAQMGAATVQKVLAAVLDDLMTDFVAWSYAHTYRDGLQRHLAFWVEHLLARIVHKALSALDPHHSAVLLDSDVQQWQDMATARVGALRVDELFDIVVEWDATAPAIHDLRAFTTNPATRACLTQRFAIILQARLLHPGASTVEIVKLYIAIIRCFRRLDPKGVLLDRVARRVRRYLRDRDDTVQVIVAGLLSDAADAGAPDTLTELAVELARHADRDVGADDGDFDWNNMDWVPDPVDAAPDYLKSKNTDVIGSLITLFDTKDVFVKELQASLADRLLKNKPNFQQEIAVLEHLKVRFGDSALQSCEVMLRDVVDSRKVDHAVRADVGLPRDGGPDAPAETVELHAKILSRLFWPHMADQTFRVPRIVAEQQAYYARGFEARKRSRKLTWVPAVGQVEIVLELDDRVYEDEVLPWQAAVIYAFQERQPTAPVTRTVAELATDLAMSPALVRSACIFWVSKRILVEPSKGTFAVLERLPGHASDDVVMSDVPEAGRGVNAAAAVAAAEAAAAQAAKEAEEAERHKKMAIYHQFVVSMLTNQGAMPLARVAMMLGIVVPGGFPFSNEELKDFLAGMVRDGILEVGHGGNYKVAS